MKLIFKGKCKNVNALPESTLPDNAVPFREPENAVTLNLMAAVFCIPLGIVILCFLIGKMLLGGSLGGSSVVGFLLALVAILPHELLHAVCFPKDAEVHLYYTNWGAFVVCDAPITKARFIWLSLTPMLVLGVLSLLVWLFVPGGFWADALQTFGVLNLLFGCGDCVNIWNAARQMPKGSLQQLSGFHSYWYMP